MTVGKAGLVSDSLRLLENLELIPEPVAKPFLIAVGGLPGTGKTYFCHQLVERLQVVLLESDALRKKLYPHPTYSFRESAHLFGVIHRMLSILLSRGISVVLDATNLAEKSRRYLYHIADRLGVKLILVWTTAPTGLVRARLQARQTNPDTLSDADWEVYRKLKPGVERIQRKHYTVDTSKDITPILNRVVRAALR